MRKKTRVFPKEERVLLTHSRILLDFPVLQETIREYPELKRSQLGMLSKEAQRYILYEYNRILNAAADEWHLADSHQYQPIYVGESEEHTCCELCGNKQCDVLYPILNHDEKVILYVGSTCITKFFPQSGAAIKELEKKRKGLIAYSRLTDYFPGVYEKFLSTTNSCVEDRDYLVVDPLYTDCKTCFTQIRELCNQHQAADDEQLPEINQKIQESLELYKDFEKKTELYLADAADNPNIPNKNVVNRLRMLKKSNMISRIRKEEGITAKTIYAIDEVDFLARYYLQSIKDITRSLPVHIFAVDERNGAVGYLAKIGDSNNTVFVSHTAFAKEFGENIIQKTIIMKVKTALKMCRICQETHINSLIENCGVRMAFYRISAIAYREDTEELYCRIDGKVSRVAIQDAINQDIAFFIDPANYSLENLPATLRQKDHIISDEDWKEITKAYRDMLFFFH